MRESKKESRGVLIAAVALESYVLVKQFFLINQYIHAAVFHCSVLS